MSRSSPNFSKILTPDSPARTQEQIAVRQRQTEDYIKKNPRKLSYDDQEIDAAIPRRNVYHPTEDESKRAKKDTTKSTSQNHIISDHYIQAVLSACITSIRSLAKKKDKASGALLQEKKAGVLKFINEIFHKNEPDKLKKARKLFSSNLSGKNLKEFPMYVASNGSNNAVEGNASVNSGVSKHMDAPTDIQGKLLKPFERMRNAFLELGNITSRNVNSWDKKIFGLVLDAITPNIVNKHIRSSTLVFKETTTKSGFSEEPASVGNYEKNFHKGIKTKETEITGNLSKAKKTHILNRHTFPRARTPHASMSRHKIEDAQELSHVNKYNLRSKTTRNFP